jgi:hypothetical protein
MCTGITMNVVSTLDRFLLYICCIYIHYIKMNFKIKPHDSLYSILNKTLLLLIQQNVHYFDDLNSTSSLILRYNFTPGGYVVITGVYICY